MSPLLSRPTRRRLAAQCLWVFGLLSTLVPPAMSQERNVNIASLGPQVGAQVPDFSLVDQNGKTWTRSSILGPKGAMLVFIRSADW